MLVNRYVRGLSTTYQQYYLSGFYSVASLVDKFAFTYTATRFEGATTEPVATCAPPSWLGVVFPIPEYNVNPFYAAVSYLLGLVLTMATLYPVSRLIKVRM